MASIFKRKRILPIPDGAEVGKYRNRTVATWIDTRGRTHREPVIHVPADAETVTLRGQSMLQWLDDDGAKRHVSPGKVRGGMVLAVEDAKYSIAYTRHDGKRLIVTGAADHEATKRIARALEAKQAEYRHGSRSVKHEQQSEQATRPIEGHIGDYEAHLSTAGRSAVHIDGTLRMIRAIVKGQGFATIDDIDLDAVNAYAAMMKSAGKSARTIHSYLTAAKSFTRWLTRGGKLAADPLAYMAKPSLKRDRRLRRRMLLPDEFRLLRTVTRAQPEQYGMEGAERALLYETAIQTGLRQGELRSLTRGNLALAGKHPHVLCEADATKNEEAAQQYVKPLLAAALREHVKGKHPATPVFNMPRKENVATMLRADLAAARTAWLAEADDDPQLRAEREESDFLLPTNHKGHVLDFHALRHTAGAWAIQGGADPKAVQTLMRHSSITLTMDVYGHLFPGQAAQTVLHMPDFDEPTLRATGTTDATAG